MTPFRRSHLHLQGLFLLFEVSTACAVPHEVPLEVPHEDPVEVVEYAGCRAVLTPGKVCVLHPNRKLFLWVRAAPEQIEIWAGGDRIDGQGEPSGEGQRFSFSIPAAAKKVDVLVTGADGEAAWSLDLGTELQQAGLGASHDLLREVNAAITPVPGLIEDRRFAEARSTLDLLEKRLGKKAPSESLYLLAYNRGLLAENEGDYRAALAAVQKAAERAKRVLWDPYRGWMAEEKLASLLGELGRFREADQRFEALGPSAPAPCEEAQLLNNRAWYALMAREAGESLASPLAPAALLEKSLATYETCGKLTSDKKFNLLINLVLANLDEKSMTRAKGFLAQAHELAQFAPLYQRLWWLDLEARIALQEGHREEALRRFQRLEDLSLGTTSADGRLRAAFGKARCYLVLKDWTATLDALQQAETLLDEQSLQIPLYQGRETFMATRQAIVSLHVELLLERGRTADALALARHARSRMLRQLERRDRLAGLTKDQRERWDRRVAEYQTKRAALEERAKHDLELPTDQLRREQASRRAAAEELKEILDRAFLVLKDPGETLGEQPPPRPGELILAYFPLPHGWAAFAADAETVAVQRFELPSGALSPSEELSQRLLQPFRTQIERAEQIRILSSGVLQSLDFHALPFGKDILLAARPVVYGLDLLVPRGLKSSPGRHALLVADPRSDLPGAIEEAKAVHKALVSGATRWVTEELKAGQASAGNVLDRLADVDLLHYAGHGTFSGFGGWDSSLLLADETQVTLGDLLALERVPSWVVLSACDTGQSSVETPVESLGLAHAFLLAGSRAVVASTRPIDDRKGLAFLTELYHQWDHEPDLAVALQRAQLAWRQQIPQADWAGFRLFEP